MTKSRETGGGRPPVDSTTSVSATPETRLPETVAGLIAMIDQFPVSGPTPADYRAVREENGRLKEFVYLQILPALDNLKARLPEPERADLARFEMEVYGVMGKTRRREMDEEYRGMIRFEMKPRNAKSGRLYGNY